MQLSSQSDRSVVPVRFPVHALFRGLWHVDENVSVGVKADLRLLQVLHDLRLQSRSQDGGQGTEDADRAQESSPQEGERVLAVLVVVTS